MFYIPLGSIMVSLMKSLVSLCGFGNQFKDVNLASGKYLFPHVPHLHPSIYGELYMV